MYRRPGQGILEMVIAISVITISTLGTTTLIVRSIRTGRISQARIEATNFAREGVEIVRGVRDGNWLKSDQNVIDGSGGTTVAWNDDGNTNTLPSVSNGTLGGSYVASLDPSTNRWTLTPCASCDLSILLVTKYNNVPTNFYTQGGCPSQSNTTCESSQYQREIKITPHLAVNNNAENVQLVTNCSNPTCYANLDWLEVTATVTSNTLTQPVTTTERLYNWK